MSRRTAIAAEVGRRLGRVPSSTLRRELVQSVFESDPALVIEVIKPTLNRSPTLETMPLDLKPEGRLEFEDLAGLFASTSLNHGLVGMTIRQVAYIFGLARRSGARTAIEIGRWRGGTTIALAAGMGPGGKVWSIDVGEKELRVFPGRPPTFDEQTRAFCERFGLDVELLVGDARTLEVETGEVDVVLIDGDHTYEGARSDFERFGRRVRVGGGVLFDDAFDEPFFPTHSDTVGRLVAEIAAEGAFALEAQVDRLAHLVRRH